MCVGSAECKGNGGPGSEISCTGSANCDLKAGASSTATCSDSAVCKINLGDQSTNYLRGHIELRPQVRRRLCRDVRRRSYLLRQLRPRRNDGRYELSRRTDAVWNRLLTNACDEPASTRRGLHFS